jgi:uncharacterized protein (TIGR03437 family)
VGQQRKIVTTHTYMLASLSIRNFAVNLGALRGVYRNVSIRKLAGVVFLFAAALGQQMAGQTFDTSGNNLLQGTYYFREVIWAVGDNSGTLGRAISLYGTMNFDGNGNYSLSAQKFDSIDRQQLPYSFTGTYSISASGYGFLLHPLSSVNGVYTVYGLVSHGIFVGSTTEDGFNDIFIAAQLASPVPTTASFRGTYSMVDIDFPSGIPTDTLDSQFQLNPDGNGNIGTVRASGYIAASGSTVINQNIAGVRYFFSNGGANVNFGGTGNLIVGTKYLYLSADGNFVFGGSPTAWDMIVGVRSAGGATNFGGLYYQAGVTQDESQLASAFADLDTFYGAFKANSGVILGQRRRFLYPFSNSPFDFTYSGSYTLNADGTADDSNNHYIVGSGGALRVGLGKPPYLGVSVAVQAPSFTGSGVFIDPTGVVNAASSALFTSGVAPGELITIYGSNLAPSLKIDASFPFTLGGVQVMINGRPAPIYVVSPGQISAVVPFATSEFVAAIQVINNGTPSNTVTSFVSLTAPGVFTKPEGGLGSAAALHSDFSLVTASNPAQIGETLAIFVTGLGDVSPAVADGAPGPSSPLSMATNPIFVSMDGQPATTTFVGLAPQLVGLYQINVQVPSSVSSGNVTLEIDGPDFVTTEATIPIGSSGVNATEPATRVNKPLMQRSGAPAAARSRKVPR